MRDPLEDQVIDTDDEMEEEIWNQASHMAALATDDSPPTVQEFYDVMIKSARGEELPPYDERFEPMGW